MPGIGLYFDQINKRSYQREKKTQPDENLQVGDYIFYRPYRGEKPTFVNNHAEAVMRGMG